MPSASAVSTSLYKSPYQYQSPYPTPTSPTRQAQPQVMESQSFNYRDVQRVQNFNTPTQPRSASNNNNSSTADRNQTANVTPVQGAYSAGLEMNTGSAMGSGTREMSYTEESILGGPSESVKSKTRKPRITLDDGDHLIIMRSCVANKNDMTSDGRKTAFWEIVRQDLLRETGKDLALPKQVVERLMRDRHFFLENHPEERDKPPADDITELTDEWIKHIESITGPDADQARWKLPPRQERRIRHAGMQGADKAVPGFETPVPPPSQKRKRRVSSGQAQQENTFSAAQFRADDDTIVDQLENILRQPAVSAQPQPNMYHHTAPTATMSSNKRSRLDDSVDPSTPQRVIIEGGLSKQDWLDIVSQVEAKDPRIPALEAKIETLIDTTRRTHQMLVQLLKNQVNKGKQGTMGGVAGLNTAGLNGVDMNVVNGETGAVTD